MSKTLILGPPGTGKTTKLIDIVRMHIEEGVDPNRIAFVTFTKAAIHEAQERIGKKMQWLRTLHSVCYAVTGCSHVVDFKDLRMLEDELGYSVLPTNGSNGRSKGETIKEVEEQARTRKADLLETARIMAPEINPYQIKHFRETYERFKETHHLQDFTDLLARVKQPLPVDVFIVDEAQDLTALQWEAVRALCPDDATVYWAGDDDQTVHEWAGSSVDDFLALGDEADEVIVLDKSYRLKATVHNYATKLVDRVKTRYAKEWSPVGDGGEVKTISAAAIAGLNLSKGEWLMLGRNRFHLDVYTKVLEQRGILFTLNGVPHYDKWLRIITNWERMRKGQEINARQATSIFRDGFGTKEQGMKGRKYRITDFPSDKVWYEALRMIPRRVVDYLRKAFRNGESPTKPRVRVSTIHSAKGMEADNVIVLSDMTEKSHDDLIKAPDNEHRIFYVAVTRTKEALYLVTPQQERYYPWLGY